MSCHSQLNTNRAKPTISHHWTVFYRCKPIWAERKQCHNKQHSNVGGNHFTFSLFLMRSWRMQSMRTLLCQRLKVTNCKIIWIEKNGSVQLLICRWRKWLIAWLQQRKTRKVLWTLLKFAMKCMSMIENFQFPTVNFK